VAFMSREETSKYPDLMPDGRASLRPSAFRLHHQGAGGRPA